MVLKYIIRNDKLDGEQKVFKEDGTLDKIKYWNYGKELKRNPNRKIKI